MTQLDDAQKIKIQDPQSMIEKIREFPEEVHKAWQTSKSFQLPPGYDNFKRIVMLGMGGSAIGASLTKLLTHGKDRATFDIVRDYQLPNYANHETLVVAVSFSGNTEETLTAFESANQRGAKLVALSSNGKLEQIAKERNIPLFKINYDSQPRAAIAHLFIPLVAILSLLKYLDINDKLITETVAQLQNNRKSLDIESRTTNNQAKQLAQKIHGRIAIMMGGGSLSEVARRWKTQFNENAKNAAFLEIAPELCHNTIVGLQCPDNQRDNTFVLLFPSNFDHPRTVLRLNLVTKLLGKNQIPHQVISVGKSSNHFTEILQLIQLGDFVSYYLAILNGVDPTPVEPIEELKKELAKHEM